MCNTRGKDVHLCKRMCATCKFAEPPIFLPLNQPRSPGWLIFQTCFLANHPKKMWHLCYKNYLQHSWSIAPWKCDSCATKMICNKHICRFCWFSITPITVDPFSVQSVKRLHKGLTNRGPTELKPPNIYHSFSPAFPPKPRSWPVYRDDGGNATVFHRQKFYDTSFVFQASLRLLCGVGLLETFCLKIEYF